jgi:hypothetical protein
MARPCKGRLPLPAHGTTSRGKQYFSYHPFRGTKRAGKRVKLPGSPYQVDGTPHPEWWAAYRLAAGTPAPSARAGTFAALILAYKASPEWRDLSQRTQSERARHLHIVDSKWGNLLVSGVEPKHVLTLRDTLADTPAEANNVLRSLSSLFAWLALRQPLLPHPEIKNGRRLVALALGGDPVLLRPCVSPSLENRRAGPLHEPAPLRRAYHALE